ncbi:MAG: FAD-dependent oxidoreductase [Propionibacteriales bacterium]|nr:FAD-dependent oxidoreductase [Propionibacteriales bacterium]
MSPPERRKVVVLGGGMAGVAAAWRLSEPGWEGRLESITLYQRGFRLGGKGASSRGEHGRIEEHGLHVWLGYYDNAFRLLRECYAELDRESTDPQAPVRTWRDAMLPASEVGLEDRFADDWRHWIGSFARNDLDPGEPLGPDSGRPPGIVDLTRRGIQLIVDFVNSLPTVGDGPAGLSLTTSPSAPPRIDPLVEGSYLATVASLLEALVHLESPDGDLDAVVGSLGQTMASVRELLRTAVTLDPSQRRMWHLISFLAATTRGIIADGVFVDPDGFDRANDEEFLDWAIRHGADPGGAEFAFIRGLYDLVFAHDGAQRSELGVGAGTAIAVTVKMFFEYRGAIFWKMAAGMGDIVFAPLHQALVARGVRIEYFHRVDELLPGADGVEVDTIRMGRQVRLRPGLEQYDPLVRVRGLPCFADRPLLDQLDVDPAVLDEPLESTWCTWPDAEQRVLRRGVDFDVAVLAVPVDMARLVAPALAARAPAFGAMLANLQTTATVALQLWFREDEPTLGWGRPGMTVSAFERPLSTWASMPQLIEREDWPEAIAPGSIAYFCGAIDAPWPPDRPWPEYLEQHLSVAYADAETFVTQHLPHLLPGLLGPDGFRWDLLCGWDGTTDPLRSQFVRINVDPSDRYVMCTPGTDSFRLRADESGFDNLFLAGDWTDNGINAGCIEAAVLSGLQAANAVHGRSRTHRITGMLPR